jgi:hypothetical protein
VKRRKKMQANLDKICAEYGMDLLNLPAELYEKTNGLIKSSSNFSDFKNKNYNEFDLSDSLKKFLGYGLIDPLKYLQNKINGEKFDKLKEKDHPLSFDSKSFETEITKALGILVEDGPFAYFIWLKSQDKEPHQAMLIQTARILMELNLIKDISTDKDLKEELEKAFLEEISSDLTKILFVKTILEKMLIYARYKAKAMQHE